MTRNDLGPAGITEKRFFNIWPKSVKKTPEICKKTDIYLGKEYFSVLHNFSWSWLEHGVH